MNASLKSLARLRLALNRARAIIMVREAYHLDANNAASAECIALAEVHIMGAIVEVKRALRAQRGKDIDA